jgi:hypothetical protein
MAHVGSGAAFDLAQGGDDFAYTVSRKAMEEMMGVSLSNDLAWSRVRNIMERYFDGTTVLSTDFQTDMKQRAEDILKNDPARAFADFSVPRNDPARAFADFSVPRSGGGDDPARAFADFSVPRSGGGDDFAYTIRRKELEEIMGMSLSDDQVWLRVQKVTERYCNGIVEGARFRTEMKQFTEAILKIRERDWRHGERRWHPYRSA